jgi:hypothetical protein
MIIKSKEEMEVGKNYFRVWVGGKEIEIWHYLNLKKIDSNVIVFSGSKKNQTFKSDENAKYIGKGFYKENLETIYSTEWFLSDFKIIGIADNWKDALTLMRRGRKEILIKEIIK